MFLDYAEISVYAGNGGNGAVTFRREKYVPKGGPSGGNGGKGGDILVKADTNLSTLLDFKYKRNYKAGKGADGASALKDGKNGSDIIISLPIGTTIKDAESGKPIADLDKPGETIVIAKGGKGGKGNSNFATPTRRTPRFAEPGKPGESKKIILELKLIADVGLVGLPNAGKSTLISTISAARPKIADYPFTTLEPNLGIVNYKEYKSFTVADIPGIIEGAHQGKGLGLKFLRHIERTKILLFLIDITSQDYQKEFNLLFNELKSYSKVLTNKTILVAFSKADLADKDELKKISRTKIKKVESSPIIISAATRFGITELLDKLWLAVESAAK